MRIKMNVRWVLPIILILMTGCARVDPTLENYLDIAKSKGISGEYLSELSRWTRTSILYSEFDTRAYIVATYRTPEFRQAYEQEYSRLFALSQQEQARKLQMNEDRASDAAEFYFYAYNPDPNAIDFSKANSIWKIFLTDSKGSRLDPVEIRQINKITPLIEQFYPYVNQYYGKFYSIKFPPLAARQQAQPSNVKIVFTGVLGRIEVSWP